MFFEEFMFIAVDSGESYEMDIIDRMHFILNASHDPKKLKTLYKLFYVIQKILFDGRGESVTFSRSVEFWTLIQVQIL